MEELLQKLLKLVPSDARVVVAVSALIGAAICSVHAIFSPAIDIYLQGIVEPANITYGNTSMAALAVVWPLRLIVRFKDPTRKRLNTALSEIDELEAVMERVHLGRNDRVRIRRSVAEAYFEAVKRSKGTGARADVDVMAVANTEIPGALENRPAHN